MCTEYHTWPKRTNNEYRKQAEEIKKQTHSELERLLKPRCSVEISIGFVESSLNEERAHKINEIARLEIAQS